MFLSARRCGKIVNHRSCSLELGRFFSSLAEDFLYSGISALFLLIANLFPGYWHFSFIALFPFLWQINRASAKEALRLGFLLGITFLTFYNLDAFFLAPASTIIKILCGTLLFALWGWGVGLAKQSFGFNPVIVSGLWVFFELALIKLGYTSGLLAYSAPTTPFIFRLVTLFGFGVISFIVVLLNSLLVLTLKKAVRQTVFSWTTNLAENRIRYLFSVFRLGDQKVCLLLDNRGPPLHWI